MIDYFEILTILFVCRPYIFNGKNTSLNTNAYKKNNKMFSTAKTVKKTMHD